MAPHPESDKRIMLELANTHPELPPPYAVFKTNAVSTSLSQGGLFPLLSRVNSSCRPNLTRPLWDAKDGVIRLWAGRDIAEGEELVSRASLPRHLRKLELRSPCLQPALFVKHRAGCTSTRTTSRSQSVRPRRWTSSVGRQALPLLALP